MCYSVTRQQSVLDESEQPAHSTNLCTTLHSMHNVELMQSAVTRLLMITAHWHLQLYNTLVSNVNTYAVYLLDSSFAMLVLQATNQNTPWLLQVINCCAFC
jgi:hypothetical protein